MLKGIDVSHMQSDIDWSAVVGSGVSFAYAKATEQVNFTDPMFLNNYREMKAAGIPRGAYHFFHPSINPSQQAAHFVATLAIADNGVNGTVKIGPGELPPMLDLEYTKDASPGPLTYVKNVQTWLDFVEKATGRTPGIYTSASFWNHATAFSAAFARYPLWVAEYQVAAPKLPQGWPAYTFWQTGEGTTAGVSGQVDLDSYEGTVEELQALAGC
jgi:lysozyme